MARWDSRTRRSSPELLQAPRCALGPCRPSGSDRNVSESFLMSNFLSCVTSNSAANPTDSACTMSRDWHCRPPDHTDQSRGVAPHVPPSLSLSLPRHLSDEPPPHRGRPPPLGRESLSVGPPESTAASQANPLPTCRRLGKWTGPCAPGTRFCAARSRRSACCFSKGPVQRVFQWDFLTQDCLLIKV